MLKHKYNKIIFLVLLAILVIINWRSALPWYAYVIWALVFGGIIALGSYFIRLNYFVTSFNHGPRDKKEIALTFDDGPMNDFTPAVLDVLQREKVPALFFLIGKNIAGNEVLLQRMQSDGHAVGNHSYSHNYWFSLKPKMEMLEDVKKCDAEIERVLQKKPRLFRPPYGVTNPMVAFAIEKGGYTSIGWSLRTYDTNAKQRDELLAKSLHKLRNGDVVLFHDWGRFTATILPQFIQAARAKGFKFVRADKLMGVEVYY
jgi:peptidoglycan-N-acetylglucosamine deacetylase